MLKRLGVEHSKGASSSSAARPPQDDNLSKRVDPLKLLDRLQLNPGNFMPAETVDALVAQAGAHWAGTAALVRVAVPKGPGAQLVVVGDLHGQLQDLLWIFHRHGTPSPTNHYLFLGDICDRGPFAIEIWAVVLAFVLRYPDAVTVLRGNHENRTMNERVSKFGGGFASECRKKCPDMPWMFEAFQSLFASLPLFAVVNDHIFAVHGGLFREHGVTLDRLRTLEAARDYPAPRTRKEAAKGEPLHWTKDEAIVFDAQWSDPHDGEGLRQSKRGIDGITFGEDVTKSFLESNGLSFVVRGHELPPKNRGYHFQHGDRLLTVFSASNYSGMAKNRGGVLSLAFPPDGSGQVKARLSEHVAPALNDVAGRMSKAADIHDHAVSRVINALSDSAGAPEEFHIDASSTAGECRAAVLKGLSYHAQTMLCMHRDALWGFCRSHDADGGGTVEAEAFAEELARCTSAFDGSGDDEVAVWRAVLDEAFGAVGADGLVRYEPLLARFRAIWPDGGRCSDGSEGELAVASVNRLVGAILEQELTLNEAIALFDKNMSSSVDLGECGEVLTKLLPALSERQVHNVLQTLQKLWGGRREVRISQFFAALCMEFSPPLSPPEPWLAKALVEIRSQLVDGTAAEASNNIDLKRVGEVLLSKFQEWDVNGDGLLTPEEIVAALSGEDNLDLSACGLDTEERIRDFVIYIDGNHSGTVGIFELLQAFTWSAPVTSTGETSSDDPTSSAEDFTADVADGVHTLLLTHRPALKMVCGVLDAADAGVVPREDFLLALAALFDTLREDAEAEGTEAATGALRHADVMLQGLAAELPEQVHYVSLLNKIRFVDRELLSLPA